MIEVIKESIIQKKAFTIYIMKTSLISITFNINKKVVV